MRKKSTAIQKTLRMHNSLKFRRIWSYSNYFALQNTLVEKTRGRPRKVKIIGRQNPLCFRYIPSERRPESHLRPSCGLPAVELQQATESSVRNAIGIFADHGSNESSARCAAIKAVAPVPVRQSTVYNPGDNLESAMRRRTDSRIRRHVVTTIRWSRRPLLVAALLALLAGCDGSDDSRQPLLDVAGEEDLSASPEERPLPGYS